MAEYTHLFDIKMVSKYNSEEEFLDAAYSCIECGALISNYYGSEKSHHDEFHNKLDKMYKALELLSHQVNKEFTT